MKSPPITKQAALEAYHGNQAALGRALGVTRQAVNAMPDGPMGEIYTLKLRFLLKPEIFNIDPPAEGDLSKPGDPDADRIAPPVETA